MPLVIGFIHIALYLGLLLTIIIIGIGVAHAAPPTYCYFTEQPGDYTSHHFLAEIKSIAPTDPAQSIHTTRGHTWCGLGPGVKNINPRPSIYGG